MLTKRDYEQLLDRVENRTVYSLYREAKKARGRLLEYPYETPDSDIDGVLYIMLLAVYNYAVWLHLETRQILEFVQGRPIYNPQVLNRLEKIFEKDKRFLKRFLKDKIKQFESLGIEKVARDFEDEFLAYLDKVEQKALTDALVYMRQQYNELAQTKATKQEIMAELDRKLRRFMSVRMRQIARTETARFYNLGLLKSTRQFGVVAYRYQAVIDEKTCQLCLSRNGKIILANDIAGLLANVPPNHVFCRCRLIPLYKLPNNFQLMPPDAPQAPRRDIDYFLIGAALR